MIMDNKDKPNFTANNLAADSIHSLLILVIAIG
jgi:hypothetical protein